MAKLELPVAPVAKIIKNAGAERISDDAKEALAEKIELSATAITKIAISNAKEAGRKTITTDDIKSAKNSFCKC